MNSFLNIIQRIRDLLIEFKKSLARTVRNDERDERLTTAALFGCFIILMQSTIMMLLMGQLLVLVQIASIIAICVVALISEGP